MKKYLFFLIILLSISKVNATPAELYNSAWKVLDDNFYDKTMNHQNWDRWKFKYPNLTTYEDAYMAINTMLESLDDPYTIFMEPYEYKEEILDMEGKNILYGINIRKYKNKYFISPIKGGAAEKAGIKKNDILIAINGQLVENMSFNNFEDALSTNKQDGIELLIKRKGIIKKVLKIIPSEQAAISILDKPLYKTPIPKNIKYLKIVSFMDKTLANQFQEMLENYDEQYDAYIIDLRGNSGGIAKNAAVMANMLLRNKIILSMVDRDGNKKVINSNDDTMTDKPVVVLCDRNSASASEIFVAAIKDNKRGIIIGEKTYGKGIMQDIAELPDNCGMNITVKYYLTPEGEFIHKKGIEPNICIKMEKTDYIHKNDKVLKFAVKYLKNNL